MPVSLKAIRRVRYAGHLYDPGQTFDARTTADARVLIALKNAVAFTPPVQKPTPPVPKPIPPAPTPVVVKAPETPKTEAPLTAKAELDIKKEPTKKVQA